MSVTKTTVPNITNFTVLPIPLTFQVEHSETAVVLSITCIRCFKLWSGRVEILNIVTESWSNATTITILEISKTLVDGAAPNRCRVEDKSLRRTMNMTQKAP
ncbi:unnamed protein product [Lathyrus oleraceus]